MPTEPADRAPPGPAGAGPSCFVYYRVPTTELAGALAAARAGQAGLRPHLPDCHMALMQRAADSTGPDTAGQTTLMEIYAVAPGAPVPDWDRVIEPRMASALAGWLSGPRHLERFVPCA